MPSSRVTPRPPVVLPLLVHVDDKYFSADRGDGAGKPESGGRLAYATLLVAECDFAWLHCGPFIEGVDTC